MARATMDDILEPESVDSGEWREEHTAKQQDDAKRVAGTATVASIKALTRRLTERADNDSEPWEPTGQGIGPRGVAGQYEASPPVAHFAAVKPNVRKRKRIRIVNAGNTTGRVHVLPPTGGEFELEGRWASGALVPGASFEVIVAIEVGETFSGYAHDILRVHSPDGAFHVPLHAHSISPSIHLQPAWLDFGDVSLGQEVRRGVHIRPKRPVPTGVKVFIEGDGFSLVGSDRGIAEPGGTKFMVRFRPEHLATMTGRLMAQIDDGYDGQPHREYTGDEKETWTCACHLSGAAVPGKERERLGESQIKERREREEARAKDMHSQRRDLAAKLRWGLTSHFSTARTAGSGPKERELARSASAWDSLSVKESNEGVKEKESERLAREFKRIAREKEEEQWRRQERPGALGIGEPHLNETEVEQMALEDEEAAQLMTQHIARKEAARKETILRRGGSGSCGSPDRQLSEGSRIQPGQGWRLRELLIWRWRRAARTVIIRHRAERRASKLREALTKELKEESQEERQAKSALQSLARARGEPGSDPIRVDPVPMPSSGIEVSAPPPEDPVDVPPLDLPLAGYGREECPGYPSQLPDLASATLGEDAGGLPMELEPHPKGILPPFFSFGAEPEEHDGAEKRAKNPRRRVTFPWHRRQVKEAPIRPWPIVPVDPVQGYPDTAGRAEGSATYAASLAGWQPTVKCSLVGGCARDGSSEPPPLERAPEVDTERAKGQLADEAREAVGRGSEERMSMLVGVDDALRNSETQEKARREEAVSDIRGRVDRLNEELHGAHPDLFIHLLAR